MIAIAELAAEIGEDGHRRVEAGAPRLPPRLVRFALSNEVL